MNEKQQQNAEQTDRAGAAMPAEAQRVRQRLGEVGTSVRDLSRDAEDLAREWLDVNPYASLAVAAGLGYVLGGGLPHVVIRRAFGIGSRMAVDMMLARVLTRDAPGDTGK
jgi:ElaB/YqjD/DUF883 family membrane-anchored ribosome-binding protein